VDASASIWQRKTKLGSPSIFWRAKRVFSQFMTNIYSNEFLYRHRDLKVQFLYIWKFFQVKRILHWSTVILFWHSYGWSQRDSSTTEHEWVLYAHISALKCFWHCYSYIFQEEFWLVQLIALLFSSELLSENNNYMLFFQMLMRMWRAFCGW
jgi:hypothetical protein